LTHVRAMSKITFRADDDLVEHVEELDASKSEVMRAALRSYLDDEAASDASGSLDDMVAERVDDLVEARTGGGGRARDVNVNITVETPDAGGVDATVERDRQPTRGRQREAGSCAQCGEALSSEHVFCPNCGEKAARRLFCECGDELRSDWSHCPSCGRRTASADVLDG